MNLSAGASRVLLMHAEVQAHQLTTPLALVQIPDIIMEMTLDPTPVLPSSCDLPILGDFRRPSATAFLVGILARHFLVGVLATPDQHPGSQMLPFTI